MPAQVIAVSSPKGGVGKTTTTANLAIALSQLGIKTLAFDTNITTASLAYHLGIPDSPITFKDVLNNKYSLSQATYFYNEYLHVIPSALVIELNYKPLLLQEKIQKLAQYYDILLSKLVDKYDIILIDTAPGFGVESVSAMLASDSLLLITTPEFPTLSITAKAVSYADYIKRPILGIALNKVLGKSYEPTKQEIESLIQSKITAKIPEDPRVPESIYNKIPITLYKKYSPASIAYRALASTIANKPYKEGFLDRVRIILNI